MDQSIYDYLMGVVATYPKNEAMRFESKTWTYTQLKHSIDRTASRLIAWGVKPGEAIAVSMPNCPEAVYLFYAISKIGAISYNIHPLTPPEQMKHLLERASCKRLICLSFHAYAHRQALPQDVQILAINPYHLVNLFKLIAVKRMSKKDKGIVDFWSLNHKVPSPDVHMDPSSPAVYLNTGGTNGEPKIVLLSSNAINNVASKGYYLIGGERSKIKVLTAIPLFHGFGLVMGVHAPLTLGGGTVLMLKFNTKEAIKHIQKGHATVIIGVPALFNALLSRDSFYGPWLQKQNIAFVGGDSVPESLLSRWNEAMERYGSSARLYEGYGLTETVNVSNVNFKDHYKKGTIGQPLPGVHEIVVNPETLEPLPANQLGEILISGNTIMNGYLNDDKNNSEAFLTLEGVKYLRTRDYGSLDEEGYLTFKQRLKRVVKVNGETLCPSDVEQVALEDQDVYEAYCYGTPDERKGHVLRLLVVLRRGDHPAMEEDVRKAIYEKISKELTANYTPDKIVFLKRLPKTAVDKIDIKAIEAMEKAGQI
jgi:long-chain acyl-CoA synthetase